MAKLWAKHSHGVKGKNWTTSHTKNTAFTLYKKSPPLRVTIILNQSKENKKIGKVPTSCSVWDQVLDLSTLQQWRSCSFSSSSSFLPSFLSFLFYFLVFSPLVILSPRIASQQQFPFSLIMFDFISNPFY